MDRFVVKRSNGLLIIATVREVVFIEISNRNTFQVPVFQYRWQAR
ncbi:hypothetical protein [Niastella yeongjuensis]|nr:hypothetical protein [Niastella yeongjuensis]